MTLEVSISNLEIDQIRNEVLDKRGFDLSFFKPTFLSRRINVRMKVLNIASGTEYAELLRSEPNEISLLYDSISINVTKFYRDKQVWNTFSSKIIPEIIKSIRPNDTIRIWSAGCATGEEAYGLAIMFKEALRNSNNKIKIIATDINSVYLQKAKDGVYSSATAHTLDSHLVNKYFTKIGKDQYKVKKEIKDLISFHVADLLTFPVSYLDVIFCRNLLIYYGENAQDLILKKFHNVMKQNKFLVLGMDESMLGHKIARSFLPLFPRLRIYQKRSATDMLSSIISNEKDEFSKQKNYQKRSTTDMLSTFISDGGVRNG